MWTVFDRAVTVAVSKAADAYRARGKRVSMIALPSGHAATAIPQATRRWLHSERPAVGERRRRPQCAGLTSPEARARASTSVTESARASMVRRRRFPQTRCGSRSRAWLAKRAAGGARRDGGYRRLATCANDGSRRCASVRQLLARAISSLTSHCIDSAACLVCSRLHRDVRADGRPTIRNYVGLHFWRAALT